MAPRRVNVVNLPEFNACVMIGSSPGNSPRWKEPESLAEEPDQHGLQGLTVISLVWPPKAFNNPDACQGRRRLQLVSPIPDTIWLTMP